MLVLEELIRNDYLMECFYKKLASTVLMRKLLLEFVLVLL